MEPSGKGRSPDNIQDDPDEEPANSLGTILLAAFGVVSMLAAGLLWLTNQSSAPQSVAAPSPMASAPSEESEKTSREKAEAKARTAEQAAEESPSKQGGDDTRPPKLILDWIEYSPPGCDEDRSIGVNVIETRGTVDQVTLIWRAKEMDIENSRRLYREGKQWTSYVRGIPADTDVRLLAIASGPGGETTLGSNISRYC